MKTFPSLFPAAVAAVHVCALYQTDGLLHGRGLNVTQTRLAVTEQADYGYEKADSTSSSFAKGAYDPKVTCNKSMERSSRVIAAKILAILDKHADLPDRLDRFDADTEEYFSLGSQGTIGAATLLADRGQSLLREVQEVKEAVLGALNEMGIEGEEALAVDDRDLFAGVLAILGEW